MVWAAAAAAMGKTTDFRGPGAQPDPVRSFNRWKKKHSHKQSQKKQLRKQLKKPEWQVEREVISRLLLNYGKVRPAPGRGLPGRGPSGRGRGPAAGARGVGGPAAGCVSPRRWAAEGVGRTGHWGPDLGSQPVVAGPGREWVRGDAGGPVVCL